MDNIDIKTLLEKMFLNTFEFHPKFYDDFVELVTKSGQEKKIIKTFSRKSNKKYFLHMFFEKSGKGDTSYAKHVPIAMERRDDN